MYAKKYILFIVLLLIFSSCSSNDFSNEEESSIEYNEYEDDNDNFDDEDDNGNFDDEDDNDNFDDEDDNDNFDDEDENSDKLFIEENGKICVYNLEKTVFLGCYSNFEEAEHLSEDPGLVFGMNKIACSFNNDDPLNEWIFTGGPIGGLGYNVKFRNDNPDVLFVTDVWGGLFKSTDGGKNWAASNGVAPNDIDYRDGPTLDKIPVYALRIDPNNENIVWVGLQNSGALYKSTDGGVSWSKKTKGFYGHSTTFKLTEGENFSVRMIEVEPGNSDVVYVMGDFDLGPIFNKFDEDPVGDILNGYVFKSTNGGETFTFLQEFPALTRWMFINPENPNELILTTGIGDKLANTFPEYRSYSQELLLNLKINPDIVERRGVGIFKSYDGGKTWEQKISGMDTNKVLHFGGADQNPNDYKHLVVAAGNGSEQLDGVEGTFYVSKDFGETWVQSYLTTEYGTGLSNQGGGAVAFDPVNSNTVYIAGNEFYKSIDGGYNFEKVYPLLNENYGYGTQGYDLGWTIDIVAGFEEGEIYVNNYGGGVFKTIDGGRSWFPASQGYTGANIFGVDINNEGCIVANGRSKIHISSNLGNDWLGIYYSHVLEKLGDGTGIYFIENDNNNSTLIANETGGGKLFYSEDFGNSWWEIQTPCTVDEDINWKEDDPCFNTGMHVIKQAPSNDRVLYGGYIFGGIKGNSPHSFSDVPSTFGMFKSEDGGMNWIEINSNLPDDFGSRNITDIAVSYQDEDVVYITTINDGPFVTLDGGLTWTSILGELPEGQSWDDCGHNCIDEDGNEVEFDENGEQNYITRKYSQSIAVDPKDDSHIFLGTNVHGVYESYNRGQTWKETLWLTNALSGSKRMHAHATKIIIDTDNSQNIYIVDWNSGVLKTNDGGKTWEHINTGLRTKVVNDLVLSKDNKYLIAGTQGAGVYRFKLDN